jgi:putative hydrolase of the HAD superfamily
MSDRRGTGEQSTPRRSKISTVFFDLGGTLVDDRDIAGWVEEAYRLRVDVDPDDLGHAYSEVLGEADRFPVFPERRVFWRTVLERAAGREVTPATVERFVQALLARDGPMPLFSDSRRCLDELQGQRRKLGIISNSRGEEHVREILERRGIGRYFETVVSSGTEGVAKPDPEIFRRALARLKADPCETFYVGDLAHTDAKAAAAVGLHSVWLNRAGTGFGDDPPEITSLLEVPLWIRRLETGR